MTYNSHARLGTAEIVFYVPIFLTALFLVFHHGPPRAAWCLMTTFSTVRIAGGIVLIFASNDPKNVALLIVNDILLSVGVVPLVAATIGLIRIIIDYDFPGNKRLNQTRQGTRFFFIVGVTLLVAGAALEGQYRHSNLVSTGSSLLKAAYIVIIVALAVMAAIQGYFWTQTTNLNRKSKTILIGGACALPFLIVRLTYAMLSIFDGSPGSKWAGLNGSLGIFVGMGLAMEYAVVLIYLMVGLLIPSTKMPKTTQTTAKGEVESSYSEDIERYDMNDPRKH